MENKKIFIIDTNVVLFDPHAIFKFEEHDVVIPIVVIEEVDKFKRDMSENGRNARTFSRLIDELRAKGALSKGIPMKGGGKLMIDINVTEKIAELPDLDLSKPDNQMLALAKKISKISKNAEVIFVSKDINLRIKADACGVRAEDYEPSKFEREEIYMGTSALTVPGGKIDEFYAKKKLSVEGMEDKRLLANQFVFIKDETNPNHTAIGRFDLGQNAILPVFKPSEGLWGVYPRNAEQAFAIDLLLNDEIKLVSLVGKAGTGKTLLAIAAGLSKTVDEGLYSRLLVSRPVMPMGHDIGYLPGTIEEKLNPYMQPIFDNIDFLFGVSSTAKTTNRRGAGKGTQELINQGLLNIEPLTYIRGRSIPNQFMIIDEAQNLTPHEIKTIITRAGEGTKIVLTGDTMQIDHPYLDSMNNGLAYEVECFKNEAIAGHVTMVKGERSKLSELATQLMQ